MQPRTEPFIVSLLQRGGLSGFDKTVGCEECRLDSEKIRSHCAQALRDEVMGFEKWAIQLSKYPLNNGSCMSYSLNSLKGCIADYLGLILLRAGYEEFGL